jgi:prepilin-type N-terminal cleavage/methylation domain-containing protein
MRCEISKLRIANCRRGSRVQGGGDSPTSDLRPPTSRRGFTLIELLITITIIAVLAGLILGAASVAGESAREATSRHMVTRLHTLLTQFLDTYKTRRVKLRESTQSVKGVEDTINMAFSSSGQGVAAKRGAALAEARLYAKREMLLMEIPDRWSDVLLTDVGANDTDPPKTAAAVLAPLYLNGRTELANVYLRRYLALVGRTNTLTGTANTAGDIRSNQGAECLYMVITIACGDGEARTLFRDDNIGDSDGDGAPEFLDGWGRPINFLRWAPGFDSEIELNANVFQSAPTVLNGDWQTAANADHDPNDVFRSDPAAFRLVPLIYSPGRDENSGINSAEKFVTWKIPPATVTVNASGNPSYLTPRLTPYVKGSPPNYPDDYFGTKLDDTATDNVHNHLLGMRGK